MKTFKPFTSRRAENLANKMIDQLNEKILRFNSQFVAQITRDSDDFISVVCYDKISMTSCTMSIVMEVFNANLDKNGNTFYCLETTPILLPREAGEDFKWKHVPSIAFSIKISA